FFGKALLHVQSPCRRGLDSKVTRYSIRGGRRVGMSPSSSRYQPAMDRNTALKEKIVVLAQRHRRYGAGMIYLKLRQAGMVVNHKRVDQKKFWG
ncbi:IS3 family transposase, partial [Rhodocyclus tenuis]